MKAYRLSRLSVVDNKTNHVVANYSEAFRASAEFHVKILNGDLVPRWDNGVLTWHEKGTIHNP